MKKNQMICVWFFWVVFSLLLTGCVSSTGTKENVQSRSSEPAAGKLETGDLLARVGNRDISVVEFKKWYKDIRHHTRDFEEQKKETLDQIVLMNLLSFAAREEGINREAAIAGELRKAENEILAREYHKRKIKPETLASREEIEAYYADHMDDFATPVKVKLRHILVAVQKDAPEQEWEKAREKALGLKKKIDDGTDFKRIAQRYSDDKVTRSKGGGMWQREDLSTAYFTEKTLPAGIPEDVFSMENRQVSDPVRTARGYEIFKVDAKRESQIPSLSRMKFQVQKLVEKEKYDKIIEQTVSRLKEKYPVVLNTDRLAAVRFEKKKKKKKK